MKIALTLFAVLFASTASACDALCYSAPLIQRQVRVERQYVPQYKIVEQIREVPVYVERQRFVEKQYVPAQQFVERQKIVVKRQRSTRLRDTLQALTAPRQQVIRRERVVERLSY